MKKLSIAFLLAMAVVSFGCKKSGGGGGEAIAKMTEFKDKMCACKDKACTDKVTEEMTKWSQDQAKAGGGAQTKMSEEDMKKSTAIGEEMTKCMTKILTESAGATPPAGGTPPAPEGSAAAPPAGDTPPAGGTPEGSAAAPPPAGSGEGSAPAK